MLSVSTQVNPVATRLIQDTSAAATARTNVVGAPCSVFTVDVDNTANVAPSYVKLYNDASPTIGVTRPDMVCMVPASQRRSYAIPEGISFSTALSFACVQTGGTEGTLSPVSPVVVRILASL